MADIVTMPKLGFDMAEGTLVRWVKAEGEAVAKGDVIAEIETDKATVEVESSFSGLMNRHLVEQGAIVPVGTPIAVVAQPGEEVKAIPELAGAPQPEKSAVSLQTKPDETDKKPVVTSLEEGAMIKASPLARKMAEEQGLDLRNISGSGPGGRVVKKDIESAALLVAEVKAGAPVGGATSVETTRSFELPLPVFGEYQARPDQRAPMDRLRSAIGRRMVESKQQVPHFYITHEYDLEALMKLRKELNAVLPEDQKFSVNDFIVKAAALALHQFPDINASISGNEIVYHGAVNVGVAVAMDNGLMTVVVRNADVKPLRVISAEVKEMVARARSGKVRTEDIEGSTFSISNLGMFDVDHFIAIINPPETAILAVGSGKPVPVAVDGEVKVRMRMKATISADHRVTDGARCAQFMQMLANYLENPIQLML